MLRLKLRDLNLFLIHTPLQMCVLDGLLIESKLWVMSVTLATVATRPPTRRAGL